MLDHDQDLALQALAQAIVRCLETVGPVCTARLLGTVTRDLTQTDGHTDQAPLTRPHPDGQASPETREAASDRHLGASQRHSRSTGYPSAATS